MSRHVKTHPNHPGAFWTCRSGMCSMRAEGTFVISPHGKKAESSMRRGPSGSGSEWMVWLQRMSRVQPCVQTVPRKRCLVVVRVSCWRGPWRTVPPLGGQGGAVVRHHPSRALRDHLGFYSALYSPIRHLLAHGGVCLPSFKVDSSAISLNSSLVQSTVGG